DRPVRVARGIRGFTTPVRLDAVADLAVRVGRPARLEVSFDRKMAVRRDTCSNSLRTDHTGVADVDDVRALEVQADAKAREEYGRAEQHPRRPQRTAANRPSPEADPGTARDQIRERWIRK